MDKFSEFKTNHFRDSVWAPLPFRPPWSDTANVDVTVKFLPWFKCSISEVTDVMMSMIAASLCSDPVDKGHVNVFKCAFTRKKGLVRGSKRGTTYSSSIGRLVFRKMYISHCQWRGAPSCRKMKFWLSPWSWCITQSFNMLRQYVPVKSSSKMKGSWTFSFEMADNSPLVNPTYAWWPCGSFLCSDMSILSIHFAS